MNLFAELTPAENSELRRKLSSATRQFNAEYDNLNDVPPVVLAAYGLSPKNVAGYLRCMAETAVLSIEANPQAHHESDRRYWL